MEKLIDKSPAELDDAAELTAQCKLVLDHFKAADIVAIPLGENSSLTSCMVICSGSSRTQVSALADKLEEQLRLTGLRNITVSGAAIGEWAIVDAGEVMVHIMQPHVRELYRLEELYRLMGAGTEAA